MLGSYFDYTGAPIKVGAAGLGDLERVQSWRDGVLGAQFVPVDYGDGMGPVAAFKDGSLGEYEQASAGIGHTLYIDGRPVDRPVVIVHGAPTRPEPTPGGPPRGGRGPEPTPGGPPRGLYGYGCSGCGGADPSGIGAYMAAMAGSPTVIDLTDAATLREVRMATAMVVPELALVDKSVDPRPTVGPGYFDDKFYESAVWTQKDSELWAAADDKIRKLTGSTYATATLSLEKGGAVYPSPLGAAVVTSLGVGSPGSPMFGDFSKNFPVLHAFLTAAVAAGMDMSGFSCVPPYTSESDRVRGGDSGGVFAGLSGSTLAIGSLVVAGAIAAWYMSRRKRGSAAFGSAVVA